ncbi:uncharacterized protein BBOV_I001360 [Babesia bovis T2Bo]|uniref:Membrane protein, putative n=1 Tax=Babesia bovis TaxID=5865 RepID=A7AVZ2_BABBO|nr:uncharacterized protein BBOV_I001360 [Babesia bovis T2Bo]EDO05220.1 putative integral membrane protein [Babesia bovis T2Bo]|eukprot:XP_001608788.1 hypothetical protein [Babesia bovis T2Bo]
MAQYRKPSIVLLLYTTILWISQVTYDVTAVENTAVQDTVSGSPGSHEQIASSDLDRADDHIQDTTSSTGDSQGFYQRYKQFVAKHNKTLTIVFGVLFVISLLVAIGLYAGYNQEKYLPIPILLGIVVFGIILYKLYGQKILAFFRGKKAPVVNSTVDTTA